MRLSHSFLFDLDRVRTLSGAPLDEVCRATLKATDETLYGPNVATLNRKLRTLQPGVLYEQEFQAIWAVEMGDCP